MIKNYLKAAGAFLLTGLIFNTNLYAQGSNTTYLFDGQVHLVEGKEKLNVVEQEMFADPLDYSEVNSIEHLLSSNENYLYNANLGEAIPQGTLKWRALPEESTIPEGWAPLQICDNLTCFSMFGLTDGWFVDEDYYTFNEIPRGGFSPFYTNMYIPNGTTEEYGEIVIELAYDIGSEVLLDTLTFGFLALPLNLEELTSDQIQVYPNPTNDRVTVNLKDYTKLNSVALFDMQGRQIQMHKNIENTAFSINLENLAKGMYILRIENENGASAIQKIQKL